MGSKRSEPKPPKFQPVMMDAQGNFYRENPAWRNKMEKFRGNPFGLMAYRLNGLSKSGRNKFGPDMPMESDRFIPIGGMGSQQDRMHTRQGYGKAKRYDPNRKSISVNETKPTTTSKAVTGRVF